MVEKVLGNSIKLKFEVSIKPAVMLAQPEISERINMIRDEVHLLLSCQITKSDSL